MATTNLYGGYPADDEGGRIHGLFEQLASARANVHADSFNNLAALYGKSFHYWNPAKSRFSDHLNRVQPDRAYRSINKIRNIMEARDAFITGDNPAIYIDTKCEETIGRQRAGIAQRVARAYWEEYDMWGKLIDVREWCKACGNGFMQVYYDPSAGNLIKDSEADEEVFEGVVVKCCPRSAFETYWDPLARYWDDVRFVLLVSIKSREEVEGYKFKIDWDMVERDSNRSAPVAQHEQYLQLLNPEMTSTTSGDFDEDGKPRRVMVIEYYEKPSLTHPRGRYVVVIGRQVVKETDLEVGVIPIVPFDDLRVAGVIMSQTPVSDMRSSQEDLNTYYSRCLERAQMADIVGLPTAANWPTSTRQFAGRPIVIAQLSPIGNPNPVFIQGGIIRQDYIMLMRTCVEDMENAAGVSSIASRQKPGYQMSGRMGYIVTDANKAILSKISYRFRKSSEQTMRLVLTYINKFYTNERTATYIGEADRREVVRYKGEDIGTDWTLTIRLGNSLLDDPIMRGQMTLQLMSSPIIAQQVVSNPIALKKVTESVNPELAEKWFVSEQDTGVAEDENFEISKGGTPEVMPWNNDDVHEREHKRQLDSDEYLNWPELAQKYLVWHYRRHGEQKQAKFAQMAHQMAMMNMGQGGGGAATRPGQQMKGSPGVAGQQTPIQNIDANLEQQTQNEWSGAPKPGGG